MAKKQPKTNERSQGVPDTTDPATGGLGIFTQAMALTDALGMANPRNPKEHDLPALVASFRRFGFTAPPMIDESSSIMVAGHGRCEALKLIKDAGEIPPDGIVVRGDGEWMVPVLRGARFKSAIERDAYVIADNQMTIHGGWDMGKLQDLLNDFRDTGFDGLGFSAPELDSLLGEFDEPPPDDGDPRPGSSSGDDDGDDDGDGQQGFVRHDITVETTYCCPKCKYEWSGKPR